MSTPLAVVSAGDVLQLCQQTWKLQYTFKSDKTGVPREFADIEAELDALTKALSLISECLDEDQSLLMSANLATKKAAVLILESCQRTLHELEIFVASYQDVKRVTRSDGSRTIERQWRPIFIRNYASTIWTDEGGDIYDLRNILALHAQSLIFFYETIRSQDRNLLEFVLPPVAQDVYHIHLPYDGSVKAKLEEIQEDLSGFALRFKNVAPPLPRKKDSAPQVISSQFAYGANTSRPRADASREWLSESHPDDITPVPSVPLRSPSRETRNFSRDFDLPTSDLSRADRSTVQSISLPDNTVPVSPPPRAAGSYRMRSSRSNTTDSYLQPPPYESQIPVATVDSISNNLDRIELASIRGRSVRGSLSESTFTASVLPSAAALTPSGQAQDPFHQLRMIGRTPPGEASTREASEVDHIKRWRDHLFKHAAVLFDKKCASVEYTKPNEKRLGDFLMETASGPCQLYLITKGTKLTNGTTQYYNSIWLLSDDGEVVMEQRLPDDAEVIPYTIWDNQVKVVLRVPVELRFYNKHPDDRLRSTASTSWINYLFKDESVATEFQNVLLGKKLLASIRTRKTTRLFPGVAGAFANQQQLCALENLRIFQDDNTGLVYAMIHFVPEFSTGNGYMTFALNDTKHPIRVKEDSGTVIKIKGMTMSIREGTRRPSTSSDPTRASKKGQDVLITGARLEFYSKTDKTAFMMKLKEIQDSGTLADD